MTAFPQYLLRFDDVCPTMNWHVWDRVEAVLRQNHVTPIVAIVPDNRDPMLRVGPPNPRFWQRVRFWQDAGWTVALHGYQHLYVSRHRGLVGRRPLSEFAGLGKEQQRRKLAGGLEIFRQEGITTNTWVAPGHTFDGVTVCLLKELGLGVISDGFARWPYLDLHGLFWVPQQLAFLRPAPRGIWTACHHLNAWSQDDIEQFRARSPSIASASFRWTR